MKNYKKIKNKNQKKNRVIEIINKMEKFFNRNRTLMPLLLMLTFVSCDEKRVFDDYQSIPKNKWNKNQKISFSFTVKDTISSNNLFINIRNSNAYPFNNLFLITALSFPNGQKIIDTLEYEMADVTGRFLGNGFTEIKENKLFYKENVQFPVIGTYTIEIAQAMRKNGEITGVFFLEGITDVGFRVEKTNK